MQLNKNFSGTTKLREFWQILKDNFTAIENSIAAPEDYIKHMGDKANPHAVTKKQVGLEFAENTSDADKPISDAVQNAFNMNPVLQSRLFFHNDFAIDDASQHELFLDGIGKRYELNINRSYLYHAYLLIKKTNGTTESYEAKGVIQKGETNNSIAQNGTAFFTHLYSIGPQLFDSKAQVFADDGDGYLKILVNGIAGQSVYCNCWVDIMERLDSSIT